MASVVERETVAKARQQKQAGEGLMGGSKTPRPWWGRETCPEQLDAEIVQSTERLAAAEIVAVGKKGERSLMTGAHMTLPLSSEERDALRAAEARIDLLVVDIYGKQLEVARELRTIRDKKLYRGTHRRFEDYIRARFARTRDWAYKLIRNFDVKEGLQCHTDVEAPLQTVTAREAAYLARVKDDPAKMRVVLEKAEKTAQAENRPRTPQDVQEAVEAVMQSSGSTISHERYGSSTFTAACRVRVTGIAYPGEDTEDVSEYLTGLANWLRDNPTDRSFTIRVRKSRKAVSEVLAAKVAATS